MTQAGPPLPPVSEEFDARRELQELVACLKAHAQWLDATGAVGVARSPGIGVTRRSAPTHEDAAHSVPSHSVPAHSMPSHPVPAHSVPRGAVAPEAEPAPNASRTAPPDAQDRARSGERSSASEPGRIGSVRPDLAGAPGGHTDESDPRLAQLRELAAQIRACEQCGLCRERTQTVFSRGNPAAELCFVGEAPGADEDAQGEPFVGKAGQLLDKMVEAMGLGRDEVYICNIVKCRPPANRKPEPPEMAACLPYLTEQLRIVSPKVIVALGTTALEGMFGATGGIVRNRGQWRLYRGTTPVMPTYHPAYLLRNPAAKRETWADLQAVIRQLGRQLPPTRGR